MRVNVNGVFFFTNKDYKNLKYKYLDRVKYRNFIKDLHSQRFLEYTLNSSTGWVLPFVLGTVKIVKHFESKPTYIYNNQKAKQTLNHHTSGLIYGFILLKSNFKIRYKNNYNIEKEENENSIFNYLLFKFKANRDFKRLLAKRIKSNDIPNYETKSEFYKHSK